MIFAECYKRQKYVKGADCFCVKRLIRADFRACRALKINFRGLLQSIIFV